MFRKKKQIFSIKYLYDFIYRCGFATVHDVRDKTLEDRMESFFLSETCKYLFLVRLFILKINLYSLSI